MPKVCPKLAFLAAALAVSTAVAAGRLGERYLVEMRVHAPDGCRLVSFLPATNGAPRVWSEERLGQWKKRVASRVLMPGGAHLRPSDIYPLPFAEPFAAIPARVEFLRFIAKGQEGMEAIPFPDGSFQTNRFSVTDLPNGRGEVVLRWLRDNKTAPFVLRIGQVASQQIWFVTWEALSERWRAGIRDKRWAEVRNEMDIIRDSGRLSLDGGEAWRKRLDDFLRTHPDLWPAIAFSNATDRAVIVKCGGSSREIASGGSWKQVIREDPGESGVPWSFVVAGSEELPEEFTFEPIPWRIDNKYDFPVTVHQSARTSKGAPRLAISNRLIPSDEIISRLNRNEPNIVVRYADGTEMPLAVMEKDGLRYVEVDSRRRIQVFQIDAPFCKRAAIAPTREYYRNGDDIELKTKVELRPWPRLELTNPRNDRVITNTITYHVPGEVAPVAGSIARVVDVKPGETRTVIPEPGPGANSRIELEVRIVSSAAYATEGAFSIGIDKFRRGASGVRISPEPKCAEIPPRPKPKERPHMPEKKMLNKIASKIAGIFDDINQYMTSMIEKREYMRTQVMGLPEDRKAAIRAVSEHLASCNEGCDECRGFRTHLMAVGSSFTNPTDKQILLACYREKLIERDRRPTVAADDSVDMLRPCLETLPDKWAGSGAWEDER